MWIVLVALDSNVVDFVEVACRSSAHIDAIEAMEPPPRFEGLAPQQEVEVFACYWLLAMAPAWRSTLYTFSDFLYDEVARAPHAGLLLRVAVDVLLREWQEPEFPVPDPAKRPNSAKLVSLGIKPADAKHVADAIGLECQRFLTNDKQLRNKSDQVQGRWQLVIRRPSEYLVEAVQTGAPWTTRAP
jgi:predicted nucleic acid-binding protein